MIRNNIYKIPLTLLLLFLLGATNAWGQTEISSLSEITDANGSYTLASDFSTTGTPANGIGSSGNPFQGTIDGGLVTIIGTWNKPLFDYVEDATIKNVIIQEVSVSTNANAGAIAANAAGATRIYNCGILGGTVSGSDNVGGLVGFLNGTSRVINCYSYANITGGSVRAGIVGYNNYASKYNDLKTMVMNCMFYGDISIGDNLYPIYGGNEISNDYKASTSNRLNNYNYFLYEAPYSAQRKITKYNCALAAEKRFLVRFEFYRHLVNSTRELAAWYATGSTANAHETMAKWVYDKSIAPYPILKVQGKYPSVVNYNPDYTYDTTTGQKVNRSSVSERNNGKLLGTLTVNISIGSGAPTGAEIKSGKSQITLNRTDKDTINYNFNYDKVQLPYYNDVGTKNYTENKVVTGWKVTVSGGSTNFTTTDYDAPNYNFADRNCTGKDNYGTSGRIFSQGAYFNVPEGVTSINIEPYWGKAAYLSDACYDRYGYNTADNLTQVGGGQRYTNGNTYSINGSNQVVYTTANNALNALTGVSSPTVYDYAVVLVGNYHHHATEGKSGPEISDGTKPFTIMSVDLNEDDEPDYCLIYRSGKNKPISPIRFDFITVPGMVMAHKNATNGDLGIPGNCTPKGWFEITTTGLIKYGQFEHSYNGKTLAPVIFMGGVIDQFVANNTGTSDAYNNKTKYMLFGDNVWFKMLSNGGHMDKTQPTPHRPISITGGEFESLYLSGYFRPDATACTAGNGDNNAECYIDGGKLGEVAGAGLENISGNITWLIDHADIKSFFGGGLKVIENGSQITGNINTAIKNSSVGLFCGGPKFGDMAANMAVATTATDCTFGTYFGAGYGGTSIYRECPKDFNKFEDKNYDFNGWIASSYDNSGKVTYRGKYNSGKGVACGYEYELFGGSAGNVGRLYLKYASFSLAQTNHVTSSLTGCTITGNYYGGGSLGKVAGDATSTLTNCTVNGSVFGAGYSASIPSAGVMALGGYTLNGVPTNPNYNETTGVYEKVDPPATTNYLWTHVESLNNGNQALIDDGYTIKTTEDLTSLGTVTGKVTLNIEGTTTVGKSVYGGGEESGVGGNTEVTVTGGTIGVPDKGGYRYGNVYGGGKGKIDGNGNLALTSVDDLDAGLVKGNTIVTISQESAEKPTTIYHNVYGGGAVGSVGTFTRDANGNPTACADNTGQATVTIKGGTIGHNRKDSGMVNGSSRGWEGNPNGEGAFAFLNQLAWVNNSTVIIGDATTDDKDKGPAILGSVYGGGENGHNYSDGIVTINKGTIGNTASIAATYDCGNVYGAGCGTDTYTIGEDPTEHHNQKAGWVRGITTITVNGGNILRNVYGGGSMGSVGNDTDAESGKATITINGGTIGSAEDSDHGHVFGGPKGSLTETEFKASAKSTLVNINAHPSDATKNPIVWGSVFGGGEAGIIKGSVSVNMNGGTVKKDVYGGGALADTQTSNWDATTGNWATGKTSASATTTVRLKGGDILGEAYGGGLGETGKPAYVYGDVLLDLNGTTTSGETGTVIAESARGCAVNEVFGCNNAAGTPMGDVLVHVYATQNKDKTQIANTEGDTPVTDAKVLGTYDVKAVYGGGNLAAYEPAGGKNTTYSTKVIIDGCGLTSIKQVYGGGNAASTPATNVTVNGTYEIEELFGGGNGKDDIVINGVTKPNPGANVGFYTYDDEAANAQTPEDRAANYGYGSGNASISVFGGTIHRVFGGSNTKGNVRKTAVTLLDEKGECEFCVDEAYGGGKSAPMDAEAKLLMACIPGLQAAYGGAEAADIQGNVELNITNGTFDRIFGGNNLSGTIHGSITVNIEEIGCRPIKIGELYCGGNQAGYSVYGYDSDGKPIESGTTPLCDDPQVNVMSFTSIGKIFGGGYGDGATMVGNPTVNVNVINGKYYNQDVSIVGENAETPNHYPIPSHDKGKMGSINNVFGGGNAAKVIGNTTVNIGTLEEVYIVKEVATGYSVSGYYTRDSNGEYHAASGAAQDGTTYYEKKAVLGADIRGNVYGGGNAAEVTGDAKVQIGKKVVPAPSPEP